MDNSEILKELTRYKDKIGQWTIVLNQNTNKPFTIGYYYSKADNKYVYYYNYSYDSFRSGDSFSTELEALVSVYNKVIREYELRINTRQKIKELLKSPRVKGHNVPLLPGIKSDAQYAMGYYFDSETKEWIVYENTERYDPIILNRCATEEDAMAEFCRLLQVMDE